MLELLAKDSQGVTLKYAQSLQSNREVVLRAVQSNGGALQFASAELRSDKEVVLAAVRKSFHALVSSHRFELPFRPRAAHVYPAGWWRCHTQSGCNGWAKAKHNRESSHLSSLIAAMIQKAGGVDPAEPTIGS